MKRDENKGIIYDFCSTCIDKHPFDWLESFTKDSNIEKVIILNFKEITEDDYNRFISF